MSPRRRHPGRFGDLCRGLPSVVLGKGCRHAGHAALLERRGPGPPPARAGRADRGARTRHRLPAGGEADDRHGLDYRAQPRRLAACRDRPRTQRRHGRRRPPPRGADGRSHAPHRARHRSDLPWPERVLATDLDGLHLVNLHSPISPKPNLVKVRTHEALHALPGGQRGGPTRAVRRPQHAPPRACRRPRVDIRPHEPRQAPPRARRALGPGGAGADQGARAARVPRRLPLPCTGTNAKS